MRHVLVLLPLAIAAPAAAGLSASASAQRGQAFTNSASGATGPVTAQVDSGDALAGATADYGVLKAAFTGGYTNGSGAPTQFQTLRASASFLDTLDFNAQSITTIPVAVNWVLVTAKFSIDAGFVNQATGGAYSNLNAAVTFNASNLTEQQERQVRITQATTVSRFGTSTTVGRQEGGRFDGLPSPPTSLTQLAGDYLWTFAARTDIAYDLSGALECGTFQYIPQAGSIAQACDLGHSVYWQGIQSVTDLGGNAVNWSVSSASGFNYAFAFNNQPPSSVVPEPAAWALMIVGFGLVGTAARRRAVPA